MRTAAPSLLSVLVLALVAGAPARADDDTPTSRPTTQLPPLGHPAGHFGAPLDAQAERVELSALGKDPAQWAGKTIQVQAPIQDVCRKKGCWMVLTQGGVSMRVRFKDYAFFVPRDAKGRTVLVQGQASLEEIPEELARHYAEEGGNPEQAKQIHGPQQGLTFLATGAEVLGSLELPPQAQGTPEAVQALEQRLATIPHTGTHQGEPIQAPAALTRLRATPGARTREFAAWAQVGEWFVFGEGGADPFAKAWAVHTDGQPAVELPAAPAANSDEPR